MALALFYTFCCLACTAFNDLLFKYFARKERSRGIFVTFIGITGSAAMLFLPDKLGENWQMTLFWGVICGLFSAVGNILLIESMTNLSAGVCSTVYRMNLALVVPFSVLIFHENLLIHQYAGVFLAIAAVLAFLPGKENKSANDKHLWLYAAMIITASIFRAGLGLSCKYGPTTGASPNGINLLIEIMWIITGLAYYFLKERRHCRMDAKVIKYGIGSGILVAGILFFMMAALNAPGAKASIVLPIAQMSFIVTFLLSVLLLKEKITGWKIAAMLCGAGAMILLSWH
ncbi:MAG: hypothetical protein E7043_06540 [Lentisphaerae bacterium]|nr:hypothetical protein [Lentisphaerota bacterium]